MSVLSAYILYQNIRLDLPTAKRYYLGKHESLWEFKD